MEKRLILKQLAQATGGSLENCDENIQIGGVVTDSRRDCCGAVFVALRGDSFDGHNFAAQVAAKGAVCCVVCRDYEAKTALPCLRVDDTLRALEDIAALYRAQFDLPTVAITGSVGKTSTKEMVASVLMQRYKTLKTDGNFNNEIGVPLTLFRIEGSDEVAVIEMGMSAFGEISRLTRIVKPETAIITNIGYSHIENLKSQENILKAKLEVLEGLSADGTVILNGDDKFLRKTEGSLPFETLYYGIDSDGCDIRATEVRTFSDATEFKAVIGGSSYPIRINVAGIHHVYNALAAILVGIKYNIPIKEIAAGIEAFTPGGMRQKIERLDGCTLIRDCYNASPTSMQSGLEVLSVTKPNDTNVPSRRVAILGDMLELGDYAEQAHREVGGLCCKYDVGCLIAVGSNAKFIAEGAIEKGFATSEIYVFPGNSALEAHIDEIIKPNDVILLKGSRGMRLEEVADYIAKSRG